VSIVLCRHIQPLLMLHLKEEHHQVRETARTFADEVLAPRSRDIDEREEFPADVVRQMGELGFLGLPFPEKYGGAGLDTLAYIIAVEEVSRACASTGITLAAHVSLGCGPVYANGTEEQKMKFLVPMAKGEALGAFGLTEPGAGSDAAGTKTRAVRANGGWKVNGDKIYITNGSVAKYITFTAVTDPEKGANGISAFIMDTATKGFRAGPREKKMGLRGSDTVAVYFEDCLVPEGNLIGDPTGGFKAFMRTLTGGRISIGAMALGIAQGAFDHARAYAKQRRQFNQPIANFQAVQFLLADMATKIEASRLLVYHAAMLRDAGKSYVKEASMAKLFASEAAVQIALEAVQIHGGYGYIKEYPVERYLRDSKLGTIGEGTSEVQRLVIARELLGLKGMVR
jgi:alkylation response protein AidB-like acyl-CoA dehydrogenase